MTTFIETSAAQDFIASADTRETSPEIMEAIAFFARDESEAIALWNGDGIGQIANLTDVWERATKNGLIDGQDLMWGDRTLADVIAQ